MRRHSGRLVLALVIAGLLVAADLIARTVAEDKLAERVAKAAPGATGTSARIHSFPFLAHLLISGNVSEVDVSLGGVDVRGLRFDSITADLRKVEVDRSKLVQHGTVVVDRISHGRVRATVTEAAVSERIGVAIHLGEGRASVSVFGREIGADLAVRDGRLVIGAAGISIPGLDLVAPLLPCVPDAEIEPGRLVLTCEFTGVPAELLR